MSSFLYYKSRFLSPFRRVRWAWQRARRGWSDDDVWSMNTYIASVISEMLDSMSKIEFAYRCCTTGKHICKERKCKDKWVMGLLLASEDFASLADEDITPDAYRRNKKKVLTWLFKHWDSLWV